MEEKAKPKKQWHKPAIIVLVRRKPEEAVMSFCKYLGPFDGPLAANCGWRDWCSDEHYS